MPVLLNERVHVCELPLNGARVDSPGHCFARPALSTADGKEGNFLLYIIA